MKLVCQGQKTVETISIGSTNIYDSGERVIGSWFGRPLYGIVIQTTTPGVENIDTTVATIDSSCQLKMLSGLIEVSSNQMIPINESRNEALYVETWYTRGVIEMRLAGSDRLSKPCWIILKYTKSTD